MGTKPLLTDKQWIKIEPLLPHYSSKGRPWRNNREMVLEGILWVLKTGARWRDLPKEYPSPSTCWRRLRLWEDDDVWLKVWRAFLAELDAKRIIDWSESFIDGSFAPAKRGVTLWEKPKKAKAQSGWCCIFLFFPIINKYLCMAKRSLLSRCPSYYLHARPVHNAGVFYSCQGFCLMLA